MKHRIIPCVNRTLSLILTVQALCLCCVCSACIPANLRSHDETAESVFETSAVDPLSPTVAPAYTQGYNCADWLWNMMTRLGLTGAGEFGANDYEAVFCTAYEQGLIDDPTPRPDIPLTRAYTAETLTRALNYAPRCVSTAADLSDGDAAMMTMIYYGYYLPDESGCVYPDATLTQDEYASLLTGLDRYTALKGKRLLSFGDSIMYGLGNDGEGIADMIGQKYGMVVNDYSVSGATFGIYRDHSHIADQIGSAAWHGEEPDIILINGATNDMRVLDLGRISASYNPAAFDDRQYAGGMEYAYYLLLLYWRDVPAVYVRAHDMDCCDDATERRFGACALQIADKWNVSCVDIFEDTDFDTEDPHLRDRYTQYQPKAGHSDSIHPNAEGYARYYLPLVGDKVFELLH